MDRRPLRVAVPAVGVDLGDVGDVAVHLAAAAHGVHGCSLRRPGAGAGTIGPNQRRVVRHHCQRFEPPAVSELASLVLVEPLRHVARLGRHHEHARVARLDVGGDRVHGRDVALVPVDEHEAVRAHADHLFADVGEERLEGGAA